MAQKVLLLTKCKESKSFTFKIAKKKPRITRGFFSPPAFNCTCPSSDPFDARPIIEPTDFGNISTLSFSIKTLENNIIIGPEFPIVSFPDQGLVSEYHHPRVTEAIQGLNVCITEFGI